MVNIYMEVVVKDTSKSAKRDLSTYSLSLYVLCASCVLAVLPVWFSIIMCAKFQKSLCQLSRVQTTCLGWSDYLRDTKLTNKVLRSWSTSQT